MANHKSALKRVKQTEKRRLRNKAVKTKMKNIIKRVRLAASEKSSDEASRSLDEAQSIIDTAAKKGVIHKNTAARRVSRLSNLVRSISA